MINSELLYTERYFAKQTFDLNDYTTTGKYIFDLCTLSNSPVSNALSIYSFIVIQFHCITNFKIQILTDLDKGTTYLRAHSWNSWTDWNKITN